MATPDDYERIRNLPALAPPSGVVPNFEHPPNANIVGISVIIICGTITIGFGLARIYTRLFYTTARLEDCQFLKPTILDRLPIPM